MIVSESVEISVLNNNKKYLLSRGYDISNKTVTIKVSDLPNGSRKCITVSCDICGYEKVISYYNYNKSKKSGGYYACSSKCSNNKKKITNIEKYGVEYPSQLDEVKARVKATNLERYGVEYYQMLDIFKARVKATNLERYGVEYPSKLKEVKDRIISTNLDRYGVEYIFQSEDIKDKIKNTNIDRYGVENPMQCSEIVDKSKLTKLERYGDSNYNNRNMAKITNLERYGVEYFSQSVEYKIVSRLSNMDRYGKYHYSKTEEFKKSIKDTKLERYGDSNYNNIDKIIETNLKRYGVKYSLQSTDVRDKIISTNLNKYGEKSTIGLDNVKESRENSLNKYNKEYAIKIYSNIIPDGYKIIDYFNRDFIINHNGIHEFTSSLKLVYDRLKYSENSELCTICNPINSNSSIYENEISQWLESIGINILCGDRKILGNGQELDIYLPDYNIAIEFNGLYWHSELFKDKYYHLNKTNICIDKGISLIHIFEDDWIYKRDIIKSIILNKLNMITDDIWARKCIIKKINLNDCKKFINENHIQGYSRCKYKLGLYYENELVSVMTFGNRYINSKKEFELIRFCNKLNTNVVGGASKLFKYFINNYNFSKIISYADISIFSGNLYKILDFKFIHLSKPNYYWIVNGIRYHRFKYNKKKLVEKLNGDINKSESEIMNERGHYKIYSCGQLRFEYC